MNRLHRLLAASTLAAMFACSALAWQAAATKDKGSTASKAASTASASEIADAKAKGLVWANTSSKVYHKSDDRYYGKTKAGKFMTEDEAQKAGYRVAGESAAKKKSTDTSATSDTASAKKKKTSDAK